MNLRCLFLLGAWILSGSAVALADDWPQWHGPDRTNVSKEKGLLAAWPKDGPKLLWTYKNAGLGIGSVAIVGDKLFVLGARNEKEYAICLDISGSQPKELWATELGPIFTFEGNIWGDGPRSTPTVDGNFVYVLGGQGELACLDIAKNGAKVWHKNLIKDFGGKVMEYAPPMNWGYTESPLIDGDKLICSPGGAKGTMVALDKKNGQLIWRTKDLTDEATNASAVVAVLDGVRQYVQSTFKSSASGGGVAGVDAKDGKLLWYAPNSKMQVYAICQTPIVRDDLVYYTAQKAGCNLFKIARDAAGKFEATDLYSLKSRKVMQNVHGGVVLVGDYVYGMSEKAWTCQEFKTGKEMWAERDKLECVSGTLTYADGHLYLLADTGEVVLIKASPKGWDESGRFTLPKLSPTRETRPTHQAAKVWAHPVVANGRLYIRDQELLYCYAVK